MLEYLTLDDVLAFVIIRDDLRGLPAIHVEPPARSEMPTLRIPLAHCPDSARF